MKRRSVCETSRESGAEGSLEARAEATDQERIVALDLIADEEAPIDLEVGANAELERAIGAGHGEPTRARGDGRDGFSGARGGFVAELLLAFEDEDLLFQCLQLLAQEREFVARGTGVQVRDRAEQQHEEGKVRFGRKGWRHDGRTNLLASLGRVRVSAISEASAGAVGRESGGTWTS